MLLSDPNVTLSRADRRIADPNLFKILSQCSAKRGEKKRQANCQSDFEHGGFLGSRQSINDLHQARGILHLADRPGGID